MSSKKTGEKTDSLKENQVAKTHVNSSNILLILVIVILGVLVQQNVTKEPDNHILKELQGLKSELKKILDELRADVQVNKDSLVEKPSFKRIGDELIEDLKEVKIGLGDKPLVIDSKSIVVEEKVDKLRQEEIIQKQKKGKENADKKDSILRKKETERIRNEKAILEEKEKKLKEKSREKQAKVLNDVAEFMATKVSKMKPKKMWIPIPNSNGGHRRCPSIEIQPDKPHNSSVKVFLYEEFLSKEECASLIKAHNSHLSKLLNKPPIVCFDSLNTLQRILSDLGQNEITQSVSHLDFTPGTYCVNKTFSDQLKNWGLIWSYSTAFYPGESKFSKTFGKLIQDATQLEETHGGKFQITSYPKGVGYKEHTDCLLNTPKMLKSDRYATFLVYLNDMGAEGGGETVFPGLGIDVKPRQGRALTWNNIDYETGKCDEYSRHSAGKVLHESENKYIIQRWYYRETFYGLGRRMGDVELPEREEGTGKVACDGEDIGSCRMYDEWTPEHLVGFSEQK